MRPRTRRVLSLAAAATLPLALTPTAGAAPAEQAAPAAAAAKANASLTLAVTPLWSGTGEKVSVAGEVFNAKDYRPLTGRQIQLQARNVGSSTWSTVSRPETNSNGAFRVSLRANRSRTYRAVFPGNAWYNSKHSNWERQTAAPGAKVRTTIALHKTSNGGSKVKGRLSQLWTSRDRPLVSANVYIQARQAYGSYWFDAAHVKTNSLGYYNWNTAVKPGSCYRYRAIYKGSTTWAAKSAEASWSSCY